MGLNSITKFSLLGFRGSREVIVTGQYRTTLSIGDRQLELLGLAQGIEEDYFTDTFFTPLVDYFHEDTKFYGIRLRDAVDPSIGLDYTFTSSYSGALLGDKLQSDACMLILKKGFTIGRYATGKNYLQVGNEAQLTGGLWDSTFTDNIVAAMDNARIIESQLPNFTFTATVWSDKLQQYNDIEYYRAIAEPRRQKRRRIFR